MEFFFQCLLFRTLYTVALSCVGLVISAEYDLSHQDLILEFKVYGWTKRRMEAKLCDMYTFKQLVVVVFSNDQSRSICSPALFLNWVVEDLAKFGSLDVLDVFQIDHYNVHMKETLRKSSQTIKLSWKNLNAVEQREMWIPLCSWRTWPMQLNWRKCREMAATNEKARFSSAWFVRAAKGRMVVITPSGSRNSGLHGIWGIYSNIFAEAITTVCFSFPESWAERLDKFMERNFYIWNQVLRLEDLWHVWRKWADRERLFS